VAEAVGLIGIGLLGSALSQRLRDAGFSVTGFDIDPARGGNAASAAEVASSCRRILLSLPDSKVVAGVLDEIEVHLAGGAIIADTTTGDPEEMAAFGARLAERGVRYLDATVAGSSRQVLAGEAMVIAGGDKSALEACAPLFACFARQTFHAGPAGAGARMKLVLNLVLGLNRAVLAEGLSLAERCGVDPAAALEILKAGPAYSRVMDTKGRKMLASDFTPEARLAQHLKDVRLILDMGRRTGARLPLSELHEKLLAALAGGGFAGADNSAIIQAFR